MPADLPDFSQAVASPAQHLQTLVIPVGNLQVFTFTLPAGCYGLAFATPDQSNALDFGEVVGHVTGNRLWEGLGTGGIFSTGTMIYAPFAVDTAYENQVDLTVSNTAAGPINLDVFALLVPLKPAGNPGEGVAVGQVGSQLWLDDLRQVNGVPISLGAKASAASLPVVVASDQAVLSVSGRRRRWDASVWQSAAAGVSASTSFPAPGAGLRYYLDFLSADLFNNAAANAAGSDLQVVDNGVVIYQRTLAVQAVAGSIDHVTISDMALRQPTANAALFVKFAAAPPATVFQRLAAAVYIDT